MLLQTFVDEDAKETNNAFNTVPVLSTSCLSFVLVSSHLERSPRESSTRRLCTRKRTFSNNCPRPLRSDRGLGAGRKRSFGTSRTARRTRRKGGRWRGDDAVVASRRTKRFDDVNDHRDRRTIDGRRRTTTTATPTPSRINPEEKETTKETKSVTLLCEERRTFVTKEIHIWLY